MARLNGVFEGGGVKGIALVGALTRLEQKGIGFVGIGGTSAGSIVAALYAAGYTAQELKVILEEMDFSKLLDPSWPKFYDLWKHFGIYKGKKLYYWVYELLKKKGVVKFEDLRAKDLRIVASDLTNKEILVFDRTHFPKLEIAEAVRMSIGIPMFFEAYKWGQKLVVDGGILSNYPLWLFRDSELPITGLKLVSAEDAQVPEPPTTLSRYVGALMGTMMEAHDKEDEKNEWWAKTIHIPTGRIGATQFSLTADEKSFLFNSGYVAATQFLDGRGRHLYG